MELKLRDSWDQTTHWLLTLPRPKRRVACGSKLPVHSLARGQVQELERPLGHSLWCVQGRLWLKHEGHDADHVLQDGETFDAVHPGRLTILALSDSCFGIDHPLPSHPR